MTSPPLSQEQADGSRLYVNPRTGEAVPSITTIISVGIAKLKLPGWAGRMAAEFAVKNWDELTARDPVQRTRDIRYAHEREREKSAYLGTSVHEILERWCKGIATPPQEYPREADPYVNQLTMFLFEKRPRFIESEFTVWSHQYGYAGTGDFIAEIEGKIVLGDLKTGKNLYPEVGLQVSALAYADCIIREDGTEQPIPAVDYLAALQVRPRGWKLVPVQHGEENFRAFLSALDIYKWVNEIAPGVLAA